MTHALCYDSGWPSLANLNYALLRYYNNILSSQAKAQQKASERAGIQFALKGATAGNIQRELQMYRQEMDAKLDQANSM